MTRREWIAMIGSAPLLHAAETAAPAAPVSIAKCASYDEDLTAKLAAMFDQLGGLEKLVRNKTVTAKVNMTGSPGQRVQGKAPAITHYTHPKLLGAAANLMGRAGAKRIRFVESSWATSGPLEETMLDSGWNVRSLQSAAPVVEFENTNALGKGRKYARFKVPGNPYMYAAYDLNHSYEDTDVYVSMAKLKEHDTCGITLSCKNVFGTIPASIYGDDAGVDEPNESPTAGRLKVGHNGVRQPAKSAPQELRFGASHDAGYRVPHIVADLVAARPIHLAIIDGVETIAGGEGPWIRGVKIVRPGVLLAGLNPVCTDAVGAAVMGYNPRATRGTPPFQKCDNILQLAEAHGVGTTDLSRIDVRGVPIAQALYKFGTEMTHATGTFEVKLTPQTTDDPALGRMTIDKQFHGDLEGTSKGQMLTAGTDVKGSAGYVAIERVTGTLGGHSGTFVLQHSGTMTRGTPQLLITVVPDSGTGALAGLEGRMTIQIADGKHSYELEYSLPGNR